VLKRPGELSRIGFECEQAREVRVDDARRCSVGNFCGDGVDFVGFGDGEDDRLWIWRRRWWRSGKPDLTATGRLG